MTLETMGSTDPWMLFLYALKAPTTQDKCIQRLTKFLDYLGYPRTKEEKAPPLPSLFFFFLHPLFLLLLLLLLIRFLLRHKDGPII